MVVGVCGPSTPSIIPFEWVVCRRQASGKCAWIDIDNVVFGGRDDWYTVHASKADR
jgi:hypothetical protein